MSGYLQRLVRNAMQPAESSVRPLVGSMFSPPGYRDAPDSRPLAGQVEFAAPPGPLWPAPTSEEAVSKHSISGRSHEQATENLSQAEPPTSTSLNSPSTTTKLPQPLLVEQVATRVPELHTQITDLPRQDPQQKGTFIPLMSERPAPIGRPDTRTNGMPVSQAVANAHQQMNVSRPAGREPDQIQIVIGRVEVTAVQQAPARAAARPARRGQSLEEYLSRRDRRS